MLTERTPNAASIDNPLEEDIVRLRGGAIDYRYYERRGRILRAGQCHHVLRGLGTMCKATVRSIRSRARFR